MGNILDNLLNDETLAEIAAREQSKAEREELRKKYGLSKSSGTLRTIDTEPVTHIAKLYVKRRHTCGHEVPIFQDGWFAIHKEADVFKSGRVKALSKRVRYKAATKKEKEELEPIAVCVGREQSWGICPTCEEARRKTRLIIDNRMLGLQEYEKDLGVRA